MNDALFLANVWKQIRESGLEFILEHGDPEGIDFVANRVIAAEQCVQPTAVRRGWSHDPQNIAAQLKEMFEQNGGG